MTSKSLVTGFVTAAAGAVLVAAAAGGVTSIAASAPASAPAAPAIQPVVWDIPMPETPAPDLQGPLAATINALGSGGPFSTKTPYIAKLPLGFKGQAEKKYNNAIAAGYFPLTATVGPDIDLVGADATTFVSATSANGQPASMPLTFTQSPTSPTGWVLSLGSLMALSSAMG